MPNVAIKTAMGPTTFNYTIATPSSSSSTTIDAALPTLIFLHPVYIAHHIYHPQFSDPELRKFNLVAYDARCHGTTEGFTPPYYRRAEAAEDLFMFMEALSLPACHLVGMSMGACVGLQLAVSHPEKVLSLTMISPLPLEEPVDVAEGRQEIYDCWTDVWKDSQNPDHDALLDVICGELQLGFNGEQSSLIQAMLQMTLPHAMRNWTPERYDEFHTVSVKFFCDRKPHPLAVLKRIQCPIQLIHCGADIAYPIEFAEELFHRLQDVGLNVSLESIGGAPHFGSVTHYTEINPIVHDFIMTHTKKHVPLAPLSVVSPFEAPLLKAGWTKSSDSDEEDDFDII